MRFLFENPPLLALAWMILYSIDYFSTIWFARYVRLTLSQYITYESGVEMNPTYQKDVAEERWINPKFFIILVLISVLILAVGYAFNYVWPDMAELFAGTFLLTWLFIDLRHMRNFFFAALLKQRPDSISGHITQSYFLNQRMLAVDALNFAIICLVAWLFSWQLFFIGGLLIGLALFLRHSRLAKKKPKVITK